MTPNDQEFWRQTAQSIFFYAPGVSDYIESFLEEEECTGFTLSSKNGRLTVTARGIFAVNMHENLKIIKKR